MRKFRLMNKEIYLIRGKKEESYSDFQNRIMNAATCIMDYHPEKLKVVVTAEAPPLLSVIPFKKSKIASISVYNAISGPVESLIRLKGFAGCYRVEEALPVQYQKIWPDLQMTPGICLLTLFNRKTGIDKGLFLDRWHNSHTPLSLKIHPLWNYSRNVVNEKLSGNSTKFEGIVEEQMKTDADLRNPFRFFGKPAIIVPRMISVYRDTHSFIDYPSMETYWTREIVVKS
jgi:hypothetical protein